MPLLGRGSRGGSARGSYHGPFAVATGITIDSNGGPALKVFDFQRLSPACSVIAEKEMANALARKSVGLFLSAQL